MHMHDLPLASLEMQNAGTTPVESAGRRADRFLHARPPNRSFLPGFDFVTCNRKGTQLLELTSPDGATLVSWHHSLGSFPMISVPGSSGNRSTAHSRSPSECAFVHRSTIRRISSEDSMTSSLVRSVPLCNARARQ